MPKKNNAMLKLNSFLRSLPESFQVLETPVDIETQMDYYQQVKKIGKNTDPSTVLARQDELFDTGTPIDQKKSLLVELAAIESPEAYRIIERYAQQPDISLKAWSTMALQESRMVLESSLLDEGQVYISTGLGGKDSNLRYFVVLLHKNGTLLPFQKKLLTNEIKDAIQQIQGETESVKHYEQFTAILMLAPLQTDLQQVLMHVIEESNQYGHFLDQDFLITNMKEMSEKEIMQIIAEKHVKN